MIDLTIKNLTIGYNTSLIHNINLEVNKSKLIVIIGENGSGKSTLMKTLLKLIKPINGEILFKGKSIQYYTPKEWALVFAAVFSRMGQIPEIQVKELMTIGALANNSQYSREVSQWLEIENLWQKYANQISDGQLQKVMIARALMQSTPFVIFDEPTAHLDYKNKIKVLELLKNLVEVSGKTFIIISHDVLQSLYLADEIWYLHHGQLFNGSPQEIDQKFNLEKEVSKFTHHGKN